MSITMPLPHISSREYLKTKVNREGNQQDLITNLQTIARDTERYTLEWNKQGTEGNPYRDTEQLGICKSFRDVSPLPGPGHLWSPYGLWITRLTNNPFPPPSHPGEALVSYSQYTKTQGTLLSTVGGKNRVIGLAFVAGSPTAIALAQVFITLERNGRALGSLVVNQVPVCAEGARQDKALLDAALGVATRTFPLPIGIWAASPVQSVSLASKTGEEG